VLLAGLPEDARLAQPIGQAQTWTPIHELLASAVEVLSVPASQRRLKKPVEVQRPRPAKPARDARARIERARGAVSITEAQIAFTAAGKVRPNQAGG
jgi:hypothetical protein